MHATLVLCLSVLAISTSVQGFVPTFGIQRAPTRVRSEAPKSSAIVPIKEDTVQFTAGVVGGGAGFLLGGPVLGALGAGFLNYVSKKPDVELGGVTLSVSKTALEFYNYLATLNEKYTVLEKAQAALQQSYDKIKDNQSVDLETVEKVEVALANVSEKMTDVNDKYDLVGGGMQVLGLLGDLTEKAVNKGVELNTEYNLMDKAMVALEEAISKVKVGSN